MKRYIKLAILACLTVVVLSAGHGFYEGYNDAVYRNRQAAAENAKLAAAYPKEYAEWHADDTWDHLNPELGPYEPMWDGVGEAMKSSLIATTCLIVAGLFGAVVALLVRLYLFTWRKLA